jgi:hypothetical protein
MTATGRLFRIEIRRSIGLLALPLLVGLAWLAWLIQQSEYGRASVALWPQTSIDIAFAVVFIGPAAGGLAAWVAGRDRRRGLSDLLATTPAPASKRDLTLLAATTLWVLIAFFAAGLYLGINTAREATWGGPVWPPIFIAGLAIAAQAAIGYAAGAFAGSSLWGRLIAGLVAIVLFFAQLLPTTLRGDDIMLTRTTGTSSYPYENLAPWNVIEDIGGSIFAQPRMDLTWSAAALYAGLGGLALGIILLRRQRKSLVAWSMVTAATCAIVTGGILLVPARPYFDASPSRAIAYEPVCRQGSILVCVHPAYEPVLDDTADLVNAVVRPLVGLPGFPTRAEQVQPALEGAAVGPFEIGPVAGSPDVIGIVPADGEVTDDAEAAFVAIAAVAGQSEQFLSQLNPAQSAIAYWLMDQTGLDWRTAEGYLMPSFGDTPIKEAYDSGDITPAELDALIDDVQRAADRFGALSPEDQRAWLEANLVALRAGDLTLEDLP